MSGRRRGWFVSPRPRSSSGDLVATRERDTLRFAVGTRTEARSSVWRLWVTRDDVYLAVRMMGQYLKVSLHESGDWRIAWTANRDLKEELRADRIIRRWRRPPEFTPGWTQGPSVVIPATSLQRPLPAHVDEGAKVVWHRPPKPGKKLQFMILISRPGARITSVRFPGLSFQTVGQIKLTNGNRVWLVAVEGDLPESESKEAEQIVTATKLRADSPYPILASASIVKIQRTGWYAITDILLGLDNFVKPDHALSMKALDSARLKVVRAQEHLDALRFEARRYLDTRPYEAATERHGDRIDVFPRMKTPPPVRLSAIIGDCVSNLRSALDYVMWQLAERHTKTPLVVGKDRPYFPIFSDNKAYANNLKHLARYTIPAVALAELEKVQPYHAGHESLASLRELVNEDKHRLPLLTIAHTVGPGDIYVRDSNGVVATGATSLTIVSASADEEVEAEFDAAVFIALQNPAMPREPVEVTLGRMVKCVADVIPRFEPFLA